MKKVFIILVCLVFCTLLCSCQMRKFKKPDDTNLEFWIIEDVNDIDFSDYVERPGWFGAREYYGKGYEGTKVEDESGIYYIDPEYCVRYVVSSYPDCSSKRKHITTITITDPNINFYGINLNSSLSEIDEAMKDKGFKEINNVNNKYVKYEKKNITFTFYEDEIVINASKTNKFGIVY